MGKGAFVQIQNASSSSLTVSYSNIHCMFENGEEGSDFRPITGTVAGGKSLPPSGPQYLEAVGSGFCAIETSTFTMVIQGPHGALSIGFSENSSTWSTASPYIVEGGLSAAVSIQESGDQYRLSVVINDHSWSGATWMADTASVIGTRRLKDVVIPGTHDSGTYAISAASQIAPAQDISQWLNAVFALPIAGQVASTVIAKWACTQPLDIAGQLAAGIRYLDLRIVLDKGTYYMCHSMFSAPVDDLISAVSAFIRQNPKEIVILDFNHLYEMPDLDSNNALVEKLIAAFGNKMAPNSLTAMSTLNDFWAGGYQVVTLYAFDKTVQQYPQIWSQSQITSPWPNTTDVTQLKGDLLTNLTGRSTTQLFVLQGILTPNGDMITKGLNPIGSAPGSIESLAQQVTPQVVSWVQSWANQNLNIVIVDWFTVVPNYADSLIQINLSKGSRP
jgi:hypothetical protein